MTHMTIAARLAYRRTDIHVFGYKADASDARRFHLLVETYFVLQVRAPLVKRGIDKSEAMRTALVDGLTLPRIVKLLPDREIETVAARLPKHPIIQVADRWHSMENASATFLVAVVPVRFSV